jgi:uncharacterized protein (AIM24 family)
MDTRTKIGVQSSRTCVACLCSGLSLFMQKITGGTWAFLTCHGTIMQKTLRAGETVVVDTHSIVALEPSVEVDIRCVGCMRCQCIWCVHAPRVDVYAYLCGVSSYQDG